MRKYISISDTIRKAIAADVRSVCAISREAGVAHAVVSRLIHGHRDVTTETADKLCRVLGLQLCKAGGRK